MEQYRTEVLIIGAGAVGTALARELSRYRVKVIVADRLNDVGGDASKSNSAIVHTGFDAPPGSLESALVTAANPMWDHLCAELDIPFRRVGAILAAMTAAEEAELPAILAKAHRNGVYDLEPLSSRQVLALEPQVNRQVRSGILIPRESITDPFLLVAALAENACSNGVEFLTDCEITALHRRGGVYTAEAEDRSIEAKFVVNAAGLHTDRISGFLGIDDFTVHPRRGQFHIIDRSAPLAVGHIILPVPTKVTKGKLLAPTVHGNYLAGPTAEELADKTDAGTDREGLQEVVAGVRQLIPDLNCRDAIAQYAGLRPVRTPDGYHIRNFDRLPGYLELSGIRSTGVSASPAVAKYAAARLGEMGLKLKVKEKFVARRRGIPCFRESDEAGREALIRQDPGFSRIVCRCETVTEAEILQAIRRRPGARDLDGVKRRVRAGLGRCQGGFCGTRLPELLARELGLAMTAVSKNGRGSELLVGAAKSLRESTE